MLPDVVQIPAASPDEQMVWIRDRARAAQTEPMVRVTASMIRKSDDRNAAIFAAVKRLPNWQHEPGGLACNARAATTLRRGGSCADKTILIGAIADALGIVWRPVWVQTDKKIYDRDHVAPQLCDAHGCFWADATWTNGRYGDSPVDLLAVNSAFRQ